MVKRKTFKKPKNFSLEKLPVLKNRPKGKTIVFSPLKKLAEDKWVVQSLADCLLKGDLEGFLEIWAAHLKAKNKKLLSEKALISRSTLYDAMKGNVTLKTFFKISSHLAEVPSH